MTMSCLYCGMHNSNHLFHHVTPGSRGGWSHRNSVLSLTLVVNYLSKLRPDISEEIIQGFPQTWSGEIKAILCLSKAFCKLIVELINRLIRAARNIQGNAMLWAKFNTIYELYQVSVVCIRAMEYRFP